ncbi:Sodium-dependent nutrient amino acid transporter 1 [Halotydeus destructor]|nr:Sodium-dependent nutrient amino acid transporter 1 [Halotydeus destructor]
MKSGRSKSFAIEHETTHTEGDPAKADVPGEVDAGDGRGQWSGGIEFLLSCISVAVGLGNVWRFPYVAYQNGGGAFLIPYLVLLFIIGRPLYYLELLIGQFGGKGPIKIWKCIPGFKGVGFAQFVCNCYVMIFYNYLMALSVYYMFASFNSPLPWTQCNSEWANCTTETKVDNNSTTEMPHEPISYSEAYFYQHVIRKSKSLSEITWISYKLIGCMLFSWTIIYFSIAKGVQSLGKVAYFTALFPYVVLISLLIAALMNEGAVDGLIYFFTPQWHKLLDPIVWYKATEQSFFSLGVCSGTISMYASYNNFRRNIYKDTMIVSVLDTFTSILASAVIFSILGSMAFQQGKDIEHVLSGAADEGLVFVVYPEGLSKLKYFPQLWSIAFFLMFYTLGLGTALAQLEVLLTCIKDQYTWLNQHKSKLALALCVLFFFLGLPLTTNAGMYMVALLNNYGAGSAMFFYGIVELVGLTWIYGLSQLCIDFRFMLDRPVGFYWRFTWSFASPITILVIFVYGNYEIFSNLDTTGSGIPDWGYAIGWSLSLVALIQLPFWILVTTFGNSGTLKQNGGGAFLLPYLILLCIIGRPLYYLELLMGQFGGKGPITVWKILPAFKGLGYAQFFCNFYIIIFYNYLMALALFYMFASFNSTLPWTECNSEWANCTIATKLSNGSQIETKQEPISYSEAYFYRHVVHKSTSLSEVNYISFRLIGCMILSWTITFFSIARGVKSVGKVAYFTASFPFIILFSLLIAALMSEGAVDGLIYVFKPQWHKLLDLNVWYTATEQSFFSLGLSSGQALMYASYNNFRRDIYKDTIIVGVLDTFTSVLACGVCFSILGTMAHQQGKTIETVLSGGADEGLVFVVYAEGLSKLKYFPQLWSIAFFLMFYTLGLGSALADLQVIVTCIKDRYPWINQHNGKLAFALCLMFLILEVPLATSAGMYMMALLQNSVGNTLFFYAIIQLGGFIWIYGLNRACSDFQFMLNRKIGLYWKITWAFAAPVSIAVLCIYAIYETFFSSNTADSSMPSWGYAIQAGLAAVPVVQLPFWALKTIWERSGSLKQRIKKAFSPDPTWGPSKEADFKLWKKYNESSTSPPSTYTQNTAF